MKKSEMIDYIQDDLVDIMLIKSISGDVNLRGWAETILKTVEMAGMLPPESEFRREIKGFDGKVHEVVRKREWE